MFEDLSTLKGGIPLRFEEEPSRVFCWLMGGGMEGLDPSDLRSL